MIGAEEYYAKLKEVRALRVEKMELSAREKEINKKLEDMSDSQIKKQLEHYYMLNNVRSEESRKIVFVRNAEGVVVKIDYDTRANLFYNIDLIL